MRATYRFNGGLLGVAEQLRREIERKAFVLGVQCTTTRVGWLVRSYTMCFDGDDDACMQLVEYAEELARVNER